MHDRTPHTQQNVPSLPHSAVALAVRLALYTGVLLAAYALLPGIIQDGNIARFKEGGPIERLQLALLAVTACMFIAGSWAFRPLRQWFAVLAALSLVGCSRELDRLLDDHLPVVGWQLPAVAALAVGIAVIWRHPKRFAQQAGQAVLRRGFAILWAGTVVAVIFAQLVGHGAFLEALMGDDYVRAYKRVIEELGELFGYALLLIGSIESILEARTMRRGVQAGP